MCSSNERFTLFLPYFHLITIAAIKLLQMPWVVRTPILRYLSVQQPTFRELSSNSSLPVTWITAPVTEGQLKLATEIRDFCPLEGPRDASKQQILRTINNVVQQPFK